VMSYTVTWRRAEAAASPDLNSQRNSTLFLEDFVTYKRNTLVRDSAGEAMMVRLLCKEAIFGDCCAI
jgi:hypothetical protein